MYGFRQSEGLISVPTERFVADALLSLQKTFVVAVASLSHRAKLPGGVRRAASLPHNGVDTKVVVR
ncbi:hypothetical protein ABE61_02505 [Lysinibacillus sphaericus]|nr:hypothetical protein [Lysinibacillus sphaericus]MBG9480155.1 hypothetical protein [Lysinibacillus sphaericus]MBG9593991.1 hypothetical protein [Lysinibacillus sphaericus]